MALGFGPISSTAIGASPRLVATSQVIGGVIVQLVGGLQATASIGTAGVGVKVRVNLVGLLATGQLGLMSSIKATSPQMSVYAYPPGMTSGFGSVTSAARNSVFVTGVQATAMLGAAAGFVPTARAVGVQAVGFVGVVGAGQNMPWVEIKPSTVPGWTDVITHIKTP
jgi:hypothetical protein